MNACGLTDSIASTAEAPPPCPSCGATARLVTGICVSCVLQEALRPAPADGEESLQDLLAQVDVCDSDWRVGNYDILEEIGRGGMGVIYKARQRGSRRIVALKRVLSYHSDSSETLVRFRREAEAVASLDHPNILPIYEVGEADGLPFFTMKFAPGGSLQSVKKALREDPRQCVSLLERVARAVHHAHEQGILHRDLKPGNILLDGWREPMVSDFGLAKWLETTSDLTRTLTIFGTPGYIAPEQAGGPAASLKPAADIYSLGAILFDLLTGRPPFLGEHALAVMRQAADKPAPGLRTVVPTLDRELETICAKCLEREADARYGTAETLADDLERWLDGRPIVATPMPHHARFWRWARRNPLPATAVAGLLLVSGAALVGEATRAELRSTLRSEELSQRSIAVLPTLQLDSATVDTAPATGLADALQSGLSKIKPARAIPVAAGQTWLAGAATAQDVKEVNGNVDARLVLATTLRTVNGKQRVSARLVNGATGQVLLTRVVEAPVGSDLASSIGGLVADVNALLEKDDWSTPAPSETDPGMRNPAARDLISSARQLMLRQTIEDCDRAISCLERALEMEPNSAIAHAYLAAVTGARTHLDPDRRFLEKAEEAATVALRLNPASADAHRSLAGVYFQKGQFTDALEQALRAVKRADPKSACPDFWGWCSRSSATRIARLIGTRWRSIGP
jgi:serine/threonine protein kinase